MSLNSLATYQTSETRYRNKSKKRGGLAGLFGGTKNYIEEYQETVDHEVDLSVYLQGKFLPVVYGVQRVPGIPVFADTKANDPNQVYVVYAIAEGEVMGIYNMYVDNQSILCVDNQDSDLRSATNTDTDDSQILICTGRVDRGDTIGGADATSGVTLSFEEWLDEMGEELEEEWNGGNDHLFAEYQAYQNLNEGAIGTVSGVNNAGGLQHKEHVKVGHPFEMDFEFHSGQPHQKASNMLVSVANANGNANKFKRQVDYYTGDEPYWSTHSRLLDTAYVATKFSIDADQTTVPEIEYVIRGKSLDAYNYDGTFFPDPVYQLSTHSDFGGEVDNADNFKEGDIVTVQTSSDGTLNSWQDETNFRILHKYQLQSTRNTFEYRFILDKIPNLGINGVTGIEITNAGTGYTSNPTISFSGGSGSGAAASTAKEVKSIFGKKHSKGFINSNGAITGAKITNAGSGYTSAPTVSISGGGGSGATAVAKIGEYGVPIRKFVRLKSSTNKYWHMMTWNTNIHDTPVNFATSNSLGVSSMVTNSNGYIEITLTSDGATKIGQLYPNITSSSATSDAYIQLGGTLPAVIGSAKDKTLRVTKSGNVLTVLGSKFNANVSNFASGVTVHPASAYYLQSTTHDHRTNISALTSAELVGSYLEHVESGEYRRIESVDTSNNIVFLESGLAFTPTITGTLSSNDTYLIHGKGLDKRSSINPALQTTDMLTNNRYGKGLSIEDDIDIASVRESALLCDTRSDVTVPLDGTSANVVAGEVYKLTDGSGNHIASGKVTTTVSNATSVTFTDVSGKFCRDYHDYILYRPGDILRTFDGTTPKYFRFTGGTAAYQSTQPTATAGNWTLLSGTSINLTRVDAFGTSGSSTIPMEIEGVRLRYTLFDSDFVRYWRYIGWEDNRQWAVTRHQTNFVIDTSKSVFANMNAILSHYNGILSYSNGKYVLDVETQEATPAASVSHGVQSNPEYLDESDIIGTINLNDNSNKNGKNTIKASINDPQNHYGSRSVSFFNSDYLKADRNVVKTGSYPVTGITSYYNARIGVEKELIQSRYSKEISFTIGPRGLLLKPGQVFAFTYAPFGFESKLFRIENLTFNANCNTTVKAREYDDSIYAITEQTASRAHRSSAGLRTTLTAPGEPTSLATATAKPGIITLNWTNATDYKEASDSTEIWRATSQSGNASTAVTAHATLISVVDNAQTFNDAVGTPGTYYYWIRHTRMTTRTGDNSAQKLNGNFDIVSGTTSRNSNQGVSGTANLLSPQLDVDIASMQIKFDDSDAISPSGSAQDVTATATLRNIDASSVDFKIVDLNYTSGNNNQNDVLFTSPASANATVNTSGSPKTASITIDADTASINTTNKFLLVQATDTGETFTEKIPITITKDGSSGSIGSDAFAVKIVPNRHVVTYSAKRDVEEETDTSNITFDCSGDLTQGTFTGTKKYEFIVTPPGGGARTAQASSATDTFTLDDNAAVTVAFTSGSNTAVASGGTSDFQVGQSVRASAVPNNTTVTGLSGNNITLSANATASGNFTTDISDEPGAGQVTTVKVKLRQGSSNTVLAQDSVSIFGVKDGSDAITAFLTNPTHTVPTDSSGSIDASLISSGNVTSAGGTYKVFIGGTDFTTANTVTYTVLSESGVDATIGNQSGAYTIASSGLGDIGTVTFRATIAASVSPSGVATTIDQQYVIVKSKTGATGSAGSAGRSTHLSSTAYAISYDATGLNPTPSSIDLTATAQNFDAARHKFELDGSTIQNFGTSNTMTSGSDLDMPSNVFTTPKIYKVTTKENADASITAFDTISVYGVQQGTTGDSIYLTNAAHTFPAANNGTVADSDEGVGATEIRVFRGATQLTFDNSASGGNAGTTTYKVISATSSTTSSEADITMEASTVNNQRKFTPTAVRQGSDTGIVTFTIKVNGVNTTAIYSFSKSKKGDTGDDGNNQATVKLYKRNNNMLSGPAHPDHRTTYRFTTGVLTGDDAGSAGGGGFGSNAADLDGWSQDRDVAITGTNFVLWSCSATAIGNTDYDVIEVADWDDPVVESAALPRFRRVRVYYDAWTPSSPNFVAANNWATSFNTTYDSAGNGQGIKYDFDNDTIALGTNNTNTATRNGVSGSWSTTLGSLPYAEATLSIRENSPGGTQTITIMYMIGLSDIIKIPRDELELQWDDSNNRLNFRFGNDLAFQNATYPTKLRNDGITQAQVQSAVSDKAAFRSNIGAGTSDLTIGTGAGQALAGNTTIPTNTNQLTNGAGFFVLPSGGSSGQFLKHDGTFGTPPDTNTQLSDAQVRSKVSGSGLMSYNSSTGVFTTTATNNGSTINSSGNVASSITVGSNSKITIDPSNERILIED